MMKSTVLAGLLLSATVGAASAAMTAKQAEIASDCKLLWGSSSSSTGSCLIGGLLAQELDTPGLRRDAANAMRVNRIFQEIKGKPYLEGIFKECALKWNSLGDSSKLEMVPLCYANKRREALEYLR